MHTAGLRARVFEAGSGVGGTWYWNRYPGARCDVESMEYSYQFDEDLQQEWHWSEKYSSQPEILGYLNHVADRLDLRKDIQLETRVIAATYDEAKGGWTIETDRGDVVSTHFLVMATGCLSAANVPDVPGRDRFAGDVFHTGQWPHEPVDFTGKRVAVIGTGSSAVQSIPIIAKQAAELTVFQRTASWSLPSNNRPLSAEEENEIKANYADFRARNSQMAAAGGANFDVSTIGALEVDDDTRQAMFEHGWERGAFNFTRTFPDIMLDHEANRLTCDFLRTKIRSIVHDPAVAELLSPKIAVGCKRMCIDSGYYETYNLPHVHLVDISTTPIDEITPEGLRVGDTEYDVDTIVFATGFDAMTGSLLRVDIGGRDGLPLAEAWSAGPRTYLGLGVAGFPNLFIISGPGSPSVLTNMVVSIEQHVNWITDCIDYLRTHGYRSIEAIPDAQAEWVDHVNAVADATVFRVHGCNSWYLGANVPGKPRVFMPLVGYPLYVEKCNDVAAHGYEGFVLSK
jgi:cyclohexanone monooxygenase